MGREMNVHWLNCKRSVNIFQTPSEATRIGQPFGFFIIQPVSELQDQFAARRLLMKMNQDWSQRNRFVHGCPPLGAG